MRPTQPVEVLFSARTPAAGDQHMHRRHGDVEAFTGRLATVSLGSLRNLSVSRETGTLTWRYAVHHLAEVSEPPARTSAHTRFSPSFLGQTRCPGLILQRVCSLKRGA